jgi:uncharacterized protein YbjT (DUF2867 family)
MKALIIGATGATGKDLVNSLLRDPAYTEVVTFVRRKSVTAHPKLSEVITGFDRLEEVAGHIHGDVWFSCLGTTLKAAGSKEKQRQIDYDIPLHFAKIARQNGVSKAVILSAYGASPASKVFYSRMKGELDEAVRDLAFEQCIIFKPGMLVRKDTDRLGERLSLPVLNFFNALGLFKRFRPLSTSVLAEKMAKAPMRLPDGTHQIELDDIFKF